jgi:hypothetical protein
MTKNQRKIEEACGPTMAMVIAPGMEMSGRVFKIGQGRAGVLRTAVFFCLLARRRVSIPQGRDQKAKEPGPKGLALF